MKTLFAKFMPEGLAARFLLLLAAALLAANVAAVLVLASEGRRFDRFAQNAREVERIVTLTSALESVEPRFWRAITRAASSRFIEANVQNAPLATGNDGQITVHKRVDDLREALKLAMPDRMINVAILPRFALPNLGPNLGPNFGPNSGLEPPVGRANKGGMVALVISVGLNTAVQSNSKWLNLVSVESARNAGIGFQVLLTGLGLSLIAVLGVGLIFIRQLVRPLSALADAATAAGRGDRSARVPVEGAREFRAAAVAFNDMQSKIAGFDAERMRTLGAVGHDLRTPLTGLRIRAEMLDDEETKQAFVRALDDMTVMADGLVTFAKGTRDAEVTTIIDLVPFLKHVCSTRGAKFVEGSDAKVNARPVALGRAIGNVVDNALRYAGMATMRLQTKGPHAFIIIEDNGPGIPADKREAVFEPFVRGEDSRNADTGGAGLGLSIARAIIAAHGGSILLENLSPTGLRVTLSLPLYNAH